MPVVPKHPTPESDCSTSSDPYRASGGGEPLRLDPGVVVLSVLEKNERIVFIFSFRIDFQQVPARREERRQLFVLVIISLYSTDVSWMASSMLPVALIVARFHHA